VRFWQQTKIDMKNDFVAHESDTTSGWLDQEVMGRAFQDERLGKRFRTVLEQLANGSAQSIPLACQDWANTKAAYRFFANERVTEEDILAGHFHSTRERFAGVSGALLVLHDTTQLSYRRENIGLLNKGRQSRTHPSGRVPLCGLSLHSSLVLTPAGLPLGLAAVKFWTRQAFKGTNALKRMINPTRVPITEKESLRWLLNLQHATALLGEPDRCVHVGDRESDIYELFCAAQDAGTHFLIRSCANRRAGDGTTRLEAEMADAPVKGTHRIEVRDRHGHPSEAALELRYRRVWLLPPVAKQQQYQPVEVTAIYARERGTPKNRDRIEWKLLTDLPVNTLAAAIEKLRWYALRWKIELFHKILKSGCRVEESGLRTAERLVRLVAVCCILSWRIFWMTMINRTQPEAPPTVALTQQELDLLDRLLPEKTKAKAAPALGSYLVRIARLGGYLARAGDPVPGNIVIWRGLARLTDLTIGYALGSRIVGN
jgi:Transposase DNA-binding/Transposase Tn5 dimerisation domain